MISGSHKNCNVRITVDQFSGLFTKTAAGCWNNQCFSLKYHKAEYW